MYVIREANIYEEKIISKFQLTRFLQQDKCTCNNIAKLCDHFSQQIFYTTNKNIETSSIDRFASALLKKINLIGDSARKPDIV